MKTSRLISTVCLILFVLAGCASVPRTALTAADLNDLNEADTTAYFKLSFLSYKPGTLINGKKSFAGHVSVAIDDDGVWGFYPTVPGTFLSFPGVLRYSTEYPDMQECIDFWLTENDMEKIRAHISKWVNNPPVFFVPTSDCVTFVYSICNILGIKYNPLAVIPVSAVREIRKLNKKKAD